MLVFIILLVWSFVESSLGKIIAYDGKIFAGSGYNECEYVPVEEQEECLENKNKVPWWGWLVLAIVLVIILLTVTRMIYVRCKEGDKVKERKERRKSKRVHGGCGWTKRKDSVGAQEYRNGKKTSSASNYIPMGYIHSSSADSKSVSPGGFSRNQEFTPPSSQGLSEHPGGSAEYSQYQSPLGYYQPQCQPQYQPSSSGGYVEGSFLKNIQTPELSNNQTYRYPSPHYALPNQTLSAVPGENQEANRTLTYAELRKKERSSVYV